MKQALLKMLESFDKLVEDGFDEVLDTDVREQMADVITSTLVDPKPDYELPSTFGMFSDEGNQKVAAILRDFLAHPEFAIAQQLPTDRDRLRAFEDIDVETEEGSTYDEYFGCSGAEED